MRPTPNPAADTHHCEEAIGALDDAITALNLAMERAQLAARHAGCADKLVDLYLDTLTEIRDEFMHARNGLDNELSGLSGSDNRPGSARLSYAGAV
jgi:hypothetical protein